MKRTTPFTIALTVVLLSPGLALSQEEEPSAPDADATPAAEAPQAATPAVSDAVLSRLDAAEKEISALKQQNEDLSGQVSDLQDAQNQVQVPSDLGKTRVFGFFDMSYGKMFLSKKDSIYLTQIPVTDKSTFMSTSLNVYLGNQITNKLKFLSELRFTYQPLGNENGVATYWVLPNGSSTSLGDDYNRTDTGVTDPRDFMTYRLGGVSMERVQITYQFADYFGITAGHYLTPYGIWNVDHGSPVILMIRAPFMQTLEMIPSKQLGVQLFGRLFLASGLTLDYAGTVSNGRGPMDSVMDIDENKGLGLRWKVAYERDDFSISLGQYGYTGRYTDISKSLYVGPGSSDYRSVVTITNQYTEYDLANDILIKLYGLRLQSEAALRQVKYQVPPKMNGGNFNGNPLLASQFYAANYLSKAIYGLLAYELPEDWTGGKVRITPFVYYENFNLNDTMNNNSHWQVYSAGINTRPYSNLVLKLEYDFAKPKDLTNIMPDGSITTTTNGHIQGVTLQLAVTY
jgi:hypothetical protein